MNIECCINKQKDLYIYIYTYIHIWHHMATREQKEGIACTKGSSLGTRSKDSKLAWLDMVGNFQPHTATMQFPKR